MAQFDKTFPTLDCSACILTPKMSEVGQHENVTLLTYSELEEVSGSVGNFKVKIRKKARYVDYDKCTGCGICVEKCPRKVVDDGVRGRHGLPQGDLHALPAGRAAHPGDRHASRASGSSGSKCQVCEKVCPTDAIDFEQKDEIIELEVGNIIIATGWKMFDCKRIPQYGYGRLANVYTEPGVRAAVQRGRPDQRQDRASRRQDRAQVGGHHPLRGQPRRQAQRVLLGRSAAWPALKFGHLVLEKTKAKVYSFYIDMRANQKGYEEFYQRLLEEGMSFVRGKVAEVTDAARSPSEEGKLDRSSAKTPCWASSGGSPWTWWC